MSKVIIPSHIVHEHLIQKVLNEQLANLSPTLDGELSVRTSSKAMGIYSHLQDEEAQGSVIAEEADGSKKHLLTVHAEGVGPGYYELSYYDDAVDVDVTSLANNVVEALKSEGHSCKVTVMQRTRSTTRGSGSSKLPYSGAQGSYPDGPQSR